MAWTKEEIDRVHQLFIVEARSAAEVATVLTTEYRRKISRSAVIGLSNRQGWKKKPASSAARHTQKIKGWPTKAENLLKRLHGEGKSFAQIVTQLNAAFPDREPSFKVAAVSQKAQRLGLPMRDRSGAATGGASVQSTKQSDDVEEDLWTDEVRAYLLALPVAEMTAAEGLAKLQEQFPGKPFTRFGLMQVLRYQKRSFKTSLKPLTAEDEARAADRASLDTVARAEGLIDLMELTERKCKWPVGDPSSDDFGFCGKSNVLRPGGKPSPYCQAHTDLAYVSEAERQARRRRRGQV